MPEYVACSFDGGNIKLILGYTVLGTFLEEGETVEEIRITRSRIELTKGNGRVKAFIAGKEVTRQQGATHRDLQRPEVRLRG